MTPSPKSQPLSEEDIERLRKDLIDADFQYAALLSRRQQEFFRSAKSSRLKNYQDFKIAEDSKRVILGLHNEKVEHTGKIDFDSIIITRTEKNE